jgi:hypothetical protein
MTVVGAQGPVYSSSFVLACWCFDTFVWWLDGAVWNSARELVGV